MNESSENVLANAMHAATVWLERIGAGPECAVVVTLAPRASIGVWVAGAENVGVPPLDDAGVEAMEATASLVTMALEQMIEPERVVALKAVTQGARLQMLLEPAFGSLALRLVHAGRVVELASIDASCTLQ